jgi:alkanesulfonate monooxygenase SsuD/methylene tetrahydromethanopterin reductase-like flavin-dependent oxidoreductase (luciferase family)
MAHHLRGLDASGLGEEGRARALGDSSVLRQIYVAEDGEDWEQTIADPIDIYVRKSAVANAGEAGEALSPSQFANWRDRYMSGGWLVAGTADEIVERLTPLAKLGIANLLCWMNFGHMEDARIRASLGRFVEHVLPRLEAIEPDPELLSALVAQSTGSETDFARLWRGDS